MMLIAMFGTWSAAAGMDKPAAESGAASPEMLETHIHRLRGKIRRNEAGEIVEIDLKNRRTKDEDVPMIVTAPQLEKLALWGSGITDAAIDSLLGSQSLVQIDLENTRITDAGLAKLATLPKLKSVDLRRATRITNKGISALATMPNLTYLKILYTRVTDPALADLAKAKKLRLLDTRVATFQTLGLRIWQQQHPW